MFLTKIKKIPWDICCDLSVPYRVMTVQIGFSHKENDSDEVEFDITAWDTKQLAELFDDFINENSYTKVHISSISIMRTASNFKRQTWQIPVTWQMAGVVSIEADTLEEAMNIAKNDDSVELPSGNYVDASFELSFNDVKYIRQFYNNNQADEEMV